MNVFCQRYKLLVAAFTLVATGCESDTGFVGLRGKLASEPIAAYQSSSNRRFVYAIGRNEIGPDGKPHLQIYIYSEPPPDTAVQLAASFNGEAKVPEDSSVKLDTALAQQIIQLGGRTQAVVILRDALYRLAEAYSNGILRKDQYQAEFDLVLTRVGDIVKIQQTQADTDKSQADAAKIDADKKKSTVSALTEKLRLTTDPALIKQILDDLKVLTSSGDGTGSR